MEVIASSQLVLKVEDVAHYNNELLPALQGYMIMIMAVLSLALLCISPPIWQEWLMVHDITCNFWLHNIWTTIVIVVYFIGLIL